MVYEIIETTRKWLEKSFKTLEHEVKLLLFTSKLDKCLACNELEELVAQLAELSQKISIRSGLSDSSVEMLKYQIDQDKHPALIIQGKKEYKIRYFGVPSGLEFMPFINTIIAVSTEKVDLPQNIQNKLKEIKNPVQIQVFTTPTCPYCAKVVEMVNQFAMINTTITSDIIDAMEFRELAIHYGVLEFLRLLLMIKCF